MQHFSGRGQTDPYYSLTLRSQDYLEKETGQRTVPSVWIKQKFIGGSSDLAAISEDELRKMVN